MEGLRAEVGVGPCAGARHCRRARCWPQRRRADVGAPLPARCMSCTPMRPHRPPHTGVAHIRRGAHHPGRSDRHPQEATPRTGPRGIVTLIVTSRLTLSAAVRGRRWWSSREDAQVERRRRYLRRKQAARHDPPPQPPPPAEPVLLGPLYTYFAKRQLIY